MNCSPGLFRFLISGLVCLFTAAAAADDRDKPNIVLIFVDDLGWKDVGCYGNDFVETPRIDRLAAEGVRFTDFYAAGAVCSPTRCALQSGQNQARIGITDFIPGHWRPFERVITPRPAMAPPSQSREARVRKERGSRLVRTAVARINPPGPWPPGATRAGGWASHGAPPRARPRH